MMQPIVLPMLEKLGRRALHKRGVESRWVSTSLGRVHVYDVEGRGSGPPIVLFHGLSSSATPFGPVALRLSRDARRVVVPDYPGHGFSEHRAALTPAGLFDAIEAVLKTLRVAPAVLVGNSLGGAVALDRAVHAPDEVRGLVLISPAGAHSSDEEWEELKKRFDIRSRADGTAFARRLYHRTPWMLPLFAHELPAVLGRPAVREILDSGSNDVLPPPEAIEKLTMPILLLWGRDERLLPEAHYDYFARHLPKHAVIERPEAYAHCPHLDDPADLAARIGAFVREHVPGGGR
jgi:pimeloyl-ACP methyl ester carboxylesterase